MGPVRTMIWLRSVASILALPTMVAAVVPWLLLRGGSEYGAFWSDPSAWRVGAAIVGAMFGCVGLALVTRTVWQFATVGRGTLAPWDPPERLVVKGVYRHVRNPMISGVWLILLGELLVSASATVLWWAVGFIVVNAVYIPLSEEPGLERRNGTEYRRYAANVPRWVPRLSAWDPQERSSSTEAPN